jgi:hypothetical protein
MAVTIVGATTNGTEPAGTASGDLLIHVTCTWKNNAPGSGATITMGGTGWTLDQRLDNGFVTSLPIIQTDFKVRGATSEAPYAATLVGHDWGDQQYVIALRGQNTTTVVGARVTLASVGGSPVPDFGSVNVTGSGSALIAIHHSWDVAATALGGSLTWTSLASAGAESSVFYALPSGPGATGAIPASGYTTTSHFTGMIIEVLTAGPAGNVASLPVDVGLSGSPTTIKSSSAPLTNSVSVYSVNTSDANHRVFLPTFSQPGINLASQTLRNIVNSVLGSGPLTTVSSAASIPINAGVFPTSESISTASLSLQTDVGVSGFPTQQISSAGSLTSSIAISSASTAIKSSTGSLGSLVALSAAQTPNELSVPIYLAPDNPSGWVSYAGGWLSDSPWAFKDSVTGDLIVPVQTYQSLYLMRSSDRGLNWSYVGLTGGGTWMDRSFGVLYGAVQSSDGLVHMIFETGGAPRYARISLTRSAGAVIGYSVSQTYFDLPITALGFNDVKAEIRVIKDGSGLDRIAVLGNDNHDPGGGPSMRLWLTRSTNATPAGPTDFKGIDGTSDFTTLVQESWGNHEFVARFEQHRVTKDLYVFWNHCPAEGWANAAPCRMLRLTSSGSATWTAGTPSDVFAGASPYAQWMALCATTDYLWLVSVLDNEGICIDRVNASGVYTHNAVSNPGSQVGLMAQVAMSVSNDQSTVFLSWQTWNNFGLFPAAEAVNAYRKPDNTWVKYYNTPTFPNGDCWGLGKSVGWDKGIIAVTSTEPTRQLAVSTFSLNTLPTEGSIASVTAGVTIVGGPSLVTNSAVTNSIATGLTGAGIAVSQSASAVGVVTAINGAASSIVGTSSALSIQSGLSGAASGVSSSATTASIATGLAGAGWGNIDSSSTVTAGVAVSSTSPQIVASSAGGVGSSVNIPASGYGLVNSGASLSEVVSIGTSSTYVSSAASTQPVGTSINGSPFAVASSGTTLDTAVAISPAFTKVISASSPINLTIGISSSTTGAVSSEAALGISSNISAVGYGLIASTVAESLGLSVTGGPFVIYSAASSIGVSTNITSVGYGKVDSTVSLGISTAVTSQAAAYANTVAQLAEAVGLTGSSSSSTTVNSSAAVSILSSIQPGGVAIAYSGSSVGVATSVQNSYSLVTTTQSSLPTGLSLVGSAGEVFSSSASLDTLVSISASNSSYTQSSSLISTAVGLTGGGTARLTSSSSITSQLSLVSSYENIVSREATFNISNLLVAIASVIVPSTVNFSVGLSLNSSTALSLFSLVFEPSGNIIRVPVGQEAGRPYITLTAAGVLTRGTSGVRVVTDLAGNLYRL